MLGWPTLLGPSFSGTAGTPGTPTFLRSSEYERRLAPGVAFGRLVQLAPGRVRLPRHTGSGVALTSGGARGSSMVKALPWPGVLSTETLPPWASMIRRTLGRPIPTWAPVFLVERK